MKNNFLQVQRLRCKPKDQDTVTVLLKKEKNQENITYCSSTEKLFEATSFILWFLKMTVGY